MPEGGAASGCAATGVNGDAEGGGGASIVGFGAGASVEVMAGGGVSCFRAACGFAAASGFAAAAGFGCAGCFGCWVAAAGATAV